MFAGLKELNKVKAIEFSKKDGVITSSIPAGYIPVASRLLELLRQREFTIKKWLATPIESSLI